jgi:ferredoxin
MADKNQRNAHNAPGAFYVDATCIECLACVDAAPDFYAHDFDKGASYVKRQPTTPEETKRCREGMEACPTQAIGDDG